MSLIAVIDTETNWYDEVMSIGVVAADENRLKPVDGKYYILTPESLPGGIYSDRMELADPQYTTVCTRQQAMEDLVSWFHSLGIFRIFAYNARFDCRHLPELGEFSWYDIMRIAAYRQYNPRIPLDAECCTTGRLKRDYGVEPTLQRLKGDRSYRETHNALLDARDELQIMELLEKPAALYEQCAGV